MKSSQAAAPQSSVLRAIARGRTEAGCGCRKNGGAGAGAQSAAPHQSLHHLKDSFSRILQLSVNFWRARSRLYRSQMLQVSTSMI